MLGKMKSLCSVVWNSAYSDIGSCPSSPCPEVTRLNLSLYVSAIHQAPVPPQEPKVSACEWEFIYWPFKRMSGFPTAFSWFSRSDVLWTPLPSTGVLSWGAWLGTETSCSSGGTSAAEISVFSTTTQRYGDSPFHILALLSWLLVCILSLGFPFS